MHQTPEVEASPSRFLLLPTEIRLKIYYYALSWPHLGTLFARTLQRCQQAEHDHLSGGNPDTGFKPKSSIAIASLLPPRHETPTCLLLNRQITAEALPCLYSQTLKIDVLPPYTQALGRPMEITSFLCETALQNVQKVELFPNLADDTRGWSKLVELLLDIWCERNDLQGLKVILAETVPPQGKMTSREDERSKKESGSDIVAKVRRVFTSQTSRVMLRYLIHVSSCDDSEQRSSTLA